MATEIASTTSPALAVVDESSKNLMFVTKALESAYQGDINFYLELQNILLRDRRLDNNDIAVLVACLNGVSELVSRLDISHHSSLLSTIFGMSMWNYGPNVMEAIVELIVSLAVFSNGKLLDSCITMLVSNFVPPPYFQNLLNKPHGVTRKDLVMFHVHAALKHITDLVPLAPARVSTIVVQKRPYSVKSETTIALYVENMLRLESSLLGEYIGSEMVKAVVDRLLELDVEIGWDEVKQDYSCRVIFEMELEDIVDSSSDDDKHYDVHKYAEKLDSVMVIAFEHLHTCKNEGRLEKVFDALLFSFKKTILTAYKSKFTQFIVFYACSLDPENCGREFARILATIFFECAEPQTTRMSAVAYLASYLARAKFLTFDFVAEMLIRLVNWCVDYCERVNANKAAENIWSHRSLKFAEAGVTPTSHRLFYAGCQAVMYVMCFHMRSCKELKAEIFYPFEQVLNHKLSPLKVCLPTIVKEFLRQATAGEENGAASTITELDDFMLSDILESDLSKAFGGMERLDMYFPFDPILLKKSDRYIRPQYVFWSAVRPTYMIYETDTSSDDEDDDSEDGDRDDDVMATSARDSQSMLDECGDGIRNMSVTPDQSYRLLHNHHFRAPRIPSRTENPESF